MRILTVLVITIFFLCWCNIPEKPIEMPKKVSFDDVWDIPDSATPIKYGAKYAYTKGIK